MSKVRNLKINGKNSGVAVAVPKGTSEKAIKEAFSEAAFKWTIEESLTRPLADYAKQELARRGIEGVVVRS